MTTREIVKKLCKDRKVSLNKLEEELGFSKGYISKLGKSKPNSEYLERIAKYFGVSLEYLLTGEDGKYSVDVAVGNAAANKDKQTKRILKYLDALSQEQKDVVESMIAGIVNNKKE